MSCIQAVVELNQKLSTWDKPRSLDIIFREQL